MKYLLTGIAFATALAGCGGGGDDSSSGNSSAAASAKGIYSGTTNDGREMVGLVLGDGTYYFLYTDAAKTGIAGVVQGSGSVSGTSFTSSNAKDFSLEHNTVFDASLSSTFSSKQSLSGTINYGTLGTNSFTGTYEADSDVTPSISTIAGTYSGMVAFTLGVEPASVTISSTGSLSGTGQSGCSVSGSVTPRADVNAYNVVVNFGGSPCYYANQSFSGVAAYDPEDGGTLFAVAPNSQRTEGFLFVGDKQ